ncbi:MAG: hypothetical protein RR565_05940 [Erysipelothrix sp.]
MRKFIVALLLLSLTACTTSQKETTAKIIDPNKNYVYAEKKDNLDLDKILTDNGRKGDFDPKRVSLKGIEALFPISESIFDYEDIIINIDTEDAKNLTKEINEKNSEYLDIRTKAKKDIESGEYVFTWASRTLLKTIETQEHVSFVVRSESFMMPGHSQESIEFYSFDKKTGKRLTSEQQLESAKLDMNYIIKTIKEDFEANSVTVDGASIKRKLNEQPSNNYEESLKYLYYKLPETDSILLGDSEVFVLLKQYSQLDGDFTINYIYKIKLN